jgi:hypothetical protein
MTTASQSTSFSLQEIFGPAVRALKMYWIPFLVIQTIAGSLVVMYYSVESFEGFCEKISQSKVNGGYYFSVLTSVIGGAWIPEIIKQITGKGTRLNRAWLHDILFNMVFFGSMGIYLDVFYKLQNFFIGEDHHFKTLFLKVAIDQFIFDPLFSVPFGLLLFLIREHRYRVIEGIKAFNAKTYRTRVIPVLGPVWCFWIPTVTAVYAMPANLQFVLFLCGLSAWSLLEIFILKDTAPKVLSIDKSSDSYLERENTSIS